MASQHSQATLRARKRRRAASFGAALRAYFTAARRAHPPLAPASVLPSGLDLDADQARAVRMATAGAPGVMTMTGVAGSGKTHVITAMAEVLESRSETLVVLALAHRALYNVRARLRGKGFLRVRYATMAAASKRAEVVRNAKVVVVDEASMIDNRLLGMLLEHLPADAMLVLCGDPHQLPPLDRGFPFADALHAGVPHVHLRGQYRQVDQPGIAAFAQLVRDRRPLPASLPAGVSLRTGVERTSQALAAAVRDDEAPSGVPMVVSWRRSDVIRSNLIVQAATNHHGELALETTMTDSGGIEQTVRLRVGDRVALVENLPHLDVYNGMVGTLAGVRGGLVDLDVDGRRVRLPQRVAKRTLELGYCLTAHRAQGGEWMHVIVYQPGPVREAPRAWFYTAFSRAQTRLLVITSMPRHDFWRLVTDGSVSRG